MRALIFMTAVAASAVTSLCAAKSESLTLTVSVDTLNPGPSIDRNIYGQFAEHKGTLIYDGIWVGEASKIPNVRGIRADVVTALKNIHVPLVRWPGGCFADDYHWRDGIGPREHRTKRTNVYGQLESNQFGTHEFMDFVQQINAEPYIALNVGSGTIQEARDWLEYMNSNDGALADLRRVNGRRDPWKVKYIGVGNEMWQCGGNMRAEYYSDVLRRYSEFLYDDAPQGEARYLIASGPLNDSYDWTRTLMQNSSWTYPRSDIRVRFFHGLSLHYYTFPGGEWAPTSNLGHALGFSENEWFSTLHAAHRLDVILAGHSAVMDQYDPTKEVSLVVDEWGTWYASGSGTNPDQQQNSLRDAIAAAITFNLFHRHTDRVKIANISMMVNVFQSVILTHEDKIVLTPTYYAFDLYQPFQGATPYPAHVAGAPPGSLFGDLPIVDASAARGRDGKLYLALVNVDPQRSVHIVTNLTGRSKGSILTGPQMDSHNTFEAPNLVRPIPFAGTTDELGRATFTLPAKSVAVVSVE